MQGTSVCYASHAHDYAHTHRHVPQQQRRVTAPPYAPYIHPDEPRLMHQTSYEPGSCHGCPRHNPDYNEGHTFHPTRGR